MQPEDNDPKGIDRRSFLHLACAIPFAGLLTQKADSVFRHPRPGDPDWPSPADWQGLADAVGGRLIQPKSPIEACAGIGSGEECEKSLAALTNPFFIEEQPGATQSTGWAGAWESAPSAYAVAAASPEDVAAAVTFAREHRLRLVVKGTGHDYLGRSCAPDSLLIWTHPMRKVWLEEKFVPRGAPAGTAGLPVLHVQAGARWLEAYLEASRHGLYVQGGGCCSVGACGGFLLGGGFGSFSKKYGTGAAGLVEAEVVTADGRIRIVNRHRDADLFWALRGGGGSTYGVVTRMTLMAHRPPDRAGLVMGKITADSDDAFRRVIERMLAFYNEHLNNEHWGEQFTFGMDNTVSLFLTFQGLGREEVERLFATLEGPGVRLETSLVTCTGADLWNPTFWEQKIPGFVKRDPRPGAPADRFWWGPNSGEVSKYWYTYQSRWVPLRLFRGRERQTLADVVFAASRLTPVGFHINKGLAGMTSEALRRCRETSVNPIVYEAAALVILSSGKQGAFPGILGHRPDPIEARMRRRDVDRAMAMFRALTPNGGAYVNEADFFEPDWQQSFWGEHYPRLLSIKRRYDPQGVFHARHTVGSEGWSLDGFTRRET